ncbi:unnamed protein product [Trifolium pratense]|uniref:Uncharacterized protein n=2 Tax=Trifolium pratense TaxID=57577 RepID=A0ACB0JBJ3_TRIPR|nr:unnamed protein product [Trifolium pratense]CAJ2642393.1 unnamed protein product [Trifolium pratense]
MLFLLLLPKQPTLLTGETLYSLECFAPRIRGIESGPARKQVDLSELFKYTQMAEKAKHDEKETKKIHDSLQNLQLRLAEREYHCKNFQEKVRYVENQVAKEKKLD